VLTPVAHNASGGFPVRNLDPVDYRKSAIGPNHPASAALIGTLVLSDLAPGCLMAINEPIPLSEMALAGPAGYSAPSRRLRSQFNRGSKTNIFRASRVMKNSVWPLSDTETRETAFRNSLTPRWLQEWVEQVSTSSFAQSGFFITLLERVSE
jgi:hypothetical protein